MEKDLYHELAMLYISKIDLKKNSPEEIVSSYREAYEKIEKASKDYDEKKDNQFIQVF